LAGALHEVSNALTVVLGWLETAAEARDPGKVQAALSVAREHARRGRSLARRAIGAEDEVVLGHRDAQSLVEFAVMSVLPRAQERSVRLEVSALPGADVPLGDDGPALQILTNLLLNALDFSPPGRTVRVAVERQPAVVSITVQDEGPGIPEPRRATLFAEPRSTRPGGAGIGLAHSQRLARESGGDLRLVHSEKGACFELLWPLALATAFSASESDASSVLASARVLVVEDDAAIASLLELSLEARGAQVIVATDREGLNHVLAGRPILDAALVDLSPLGEEVAESLDAITRESPNAVVLLVSGQPTGIPPEAEGRFAAWVRKPFEMGELIETLSALLARD
jgi:CheY-like chemotaxis protein